MSTTPSAGSIRRVLEDLDVTDLVRSFVQEVADRVACVVGATASKDYIRLLGADLSQTSLYVHQGFVSVALPPNVSAHWGKATGGSIQKKQATHYLLVRQAQLDDEATRAAAVEAAEASIRHYRDVHVGLSGDVGRAETYRATCPDCFQELAVNGTCSCFDG